MILHNEGRLRKDSLQMELLKSKPTSIFLFSQKRASDDVGFFCLLQDLFNFIKWSYLSGSNPAKGRSASGMTLTSKDLKWKFLYNQVTRYHLQEIYEYIQALDIHRDDL